MVVSSYVALFIGRGSINVINVEPMLCHERWHRFVEKPYGWKEGAKNFIARQVVFFIMAVDENVGAKICSSSQKFRPKVEKLKPWCGPSTKIWAVC